jgi:hypothetical protein
VTFSTRSGRQEWLTSTAHHGRDRADALSREDQTVFESAHASVELGRQLADRLQDADVSRVHRRTASDDHGPFEVHRLLGLVGEPQACIDLIGLEEAIFVRDADEHVGIRQRDARSVFEVAETANADDVESGSQEWLFLEKAVVETPQVSQDFHQAVNELRQQSCRSKIHLEQCNGPFELGRAPVGEAVESVVGASERVERLGRKLVDRKLLVSEEDRGRNAKVVESADQRTI